MDQLYRFACGCGTPRRIFGLDRASPAPSLKAPMVPLLGPLKGTARGREPDLSRQSIIGRIGSVGLA
jgi:hypothetical protein